MALEFDEDYTDDALNYRKIEKKTENKKEDVELEKLKEHIKNLLLKNQKVPIVIKNVEVNDFNSFRYDFLKKQFSPLLKSNITTLTSLLKNSELIFHSLLKQNLIDDFKFSLKSVPRSFLEKHTQGFKHVVIPVFHINPVKKFFAKTGTNVGNNEGDGFIQLQYRNVFGGNEYLTFDATTGTKNKTSYLLNYTSPILNNSNYNFVTSLFSNTRNFDFIHSKVFNKGIINKIYTNFINSNLKHEISIENSWRILENKNSTSDNIICQSGSNFKSSIGYNLVYDSRNDKLLPKIGKLLNIGLEYNGLFKWNSYPYIKSTVQTQFTKKMDFMKSWIIATNKFGFIFPFKNSNFILDKFFIGGPNDVRSFHLNGIGPKSFNTFTGGDLFLSGGISLISNIPKKNDSNFKIHNFFNYGKLISIDFENFSVKKSFTGLLSKHSISCGFGIVYNHPFARLELNLAFPLCVNEKDIFKKGIQYGIGFTFL